MEAALMAGRTTKPKVSQAKASTIAVTLRGSPEWKTWLEALAKKDRSNVATVIDKALVKYAENLGFEEEAPER
jgi:hypothetical protein